jgi:hypothetical protein
MPLHGKCWREQQDPLVLASRDAIGGTLESERKRCGPRQRLLGLDDINVHQSPRQSGQRDLDDPVAFGGECFGCEGPRHPAFESRVPREGALRTRQFQAPLGIGHQGQEDVYFVRLAEKRVSAKAN